MSAAHEIAQWSIATSLWSTTFYASRVLSIYLVPKINAVWPAPPSLGKTIAWGALFGAYSGTGFRISRKRSATNVFTIFTVSALGASKTLQFLLQNGDYNEDYTGAGAPYGVVLSSYYVIQKLCQTHLLPVNCLRIAN